MLHPRTTSSRFRAQKSLLALAVGLACSSTAIADAEEQTELEEVVVTGFRGSLNTALSQKREDTGAIDVIASEDIGKFPDSNLAESMQRIPSVALSRGDGGEGRNISVRGLGAGFTRVRINGMEGASQTGSSDIYGAGNSGRSFDFNVFPTEIFSELAVRKTSSADVEEGSLGATVDLRAPRPLDQGSDTVFTMTARGVFNEVSEDVDPRASALFSKKFADETFGVLASVAYQKRNIREVGYSAVDILSANTNGLNVNPMGTPALVLPYCTPPNWTVLTTGLGPGGLGLNPNPNPAIQAQADQGAKGQSIDNCSVVQNTSPVPGSALNPQPVNPRTSDFASYMEVFNLRRPGVDVPGSGAFFPRLPRYVNSEQDTERSGGTLSLQWAPSENTTLSLDGLMSRYQVERRDNYILGLSLGRTISNNGQPMVSIRDVEFDDKGSVQYVVFDGMDVRSEGLVDQFTATFKQGSLTLDHSFSDSFTIKATMGRSTSEWDGPLRLQTFLDQIDVDGFSLDFRGGRNTPLIGFGNLNVTDPNAFYYRRSPDTTNAAQNGATMLGGFSFQGKPSRNVTANTLFELEGDWQINDSYGLKTGVQWRQNNFKSKVSNIPTPQAVTLNLPAGTSLADITTTIDDLDDLWGGGAPSSWVAVDSKKWREAFNYPDAFDFCNVECAANQSQMLEEISSVYAMLKFEGDWGIPIRGDVGVRYAFTRQSAMGHTPRPNPPGSTYPNSGFRTDIDMDYDDWLPALNIVGDLTPNLLLRFSAAQVMSRAELGNLTPVTNITFTTQNTTVNNPFLEPIRADTFDLGLEWYFAEGSLLSAAIFYKDIKTFIQRITADEPFQNLGLPESILVLPSRPTDAFHVSRLYNTPGGPLKGFELNAQVQFTNLPGFWSNTGFLANYTHAEAEIEYILATNTAGVPTATTTNDLVGLSPQTASGTLFYDDRTFSARITGAYRDEYIRGLPAAAGSDIQGNLANLFVDFSSSWNVNDSLSMIFEVQNLTRERNTLFIDSNRQDTLFETEIGRTFTLGASYKF